MSLGQIVENTLYFVALINPVSKVFFLTSKKPAYSSEELHNLSIKSTLAALLILITLTLAGDFLLTNIFHVEIYSLSVAGGIILFIMGLTAVREGKFFEVGKTPPKISDISIVPLAAPLIAGPGIITAAITFSSLSGSMVTIVCITLAVLINLIFMLLSFQINKVLEKTNITGPIIRITGLVVTAVAMQMIFSGCAIWFSKVV